MPPHLPGLPPLGGRRVAAAGLAVPGTVGVPRQAAVSAGFSVHVAAVQGQVGHSYSRGHVKLLLLGGQRGQGKMFPGRVALSPARRDQHQLAAASQCWERWRGLSLEPPEAGLPWGHLQVSPKAAAMGW